MHLFGIASTMGKRTLGSDFKTLEIYRQWARQKNPQCFTLSVVKNYQSCRNKLTRLRLCYYSEMGKPWSKSHLLWNFCLLALECTILSLLEQEACLHRVPPSGSTVNKSMTNPDPNQLSEMMDFFCLPWDSKEIAVNITLLKVFLCRTNLIGVSQDCSGIWKAGFAPTWFSLLESLFLKRSSIFSEGVGGK